MNEPRKYEYDAILHEDPDSGGAYVIFPWDLKKEFGKGRAKVRAEFDGIAYNGSIVNMGVRNPDGSICYIIGVLKRIRNALSKQDHYCVKPQNIEEYIAAQDTQVQPRLKEVRDILTAALPEAEERISR